MKESFSLIFNSTIPDEKYDLGRDIERKIGPHEHYSKLLFFITRCNLHVKIVISIVFNLSIFATLENKGCCVQMSVDTL